MNKLLILLLFCSQTLFSQSIATRHELGILAGALAYQGDLTPNYLGDLHTMRPALNLYFSTRLNTDFSLRLNFIRSGLRGNDANYEKPTWRQQRNFRFQSPLTEFSVAGVWHLRGLIPNDAGIVNFTPYLYGGFGTAFIEVDRDWSRFNNQHFSGQQNVTAGLASDISRELSRSEWVLPLGAGIRLGITPRVSLAMEAAYRYSFTDYLDGFSQGANPRRNDHYYSYLVGLIFSPGKNNRMDCPAPPQ